MTTVDYGKTPISKLKRGQLETAYAAAIWTRDRALEALDRCRDLDQQRLAQLEQASILAQEQRDELAGLVARVKRVRAALPVSSPVVFVSQVLAALDGPDKATVLSVAKS